MLQRVIVMVLGLSGLVSVVGCTKTSSTVTPAGKVTLQLDNTGSGMQYCDASGACQTLPYAGDCASLEVTIDPTTAQSCQVCVLADGTTVDQGCGNSNIACVLVTLPEPDCVVCAYVNGAVLYSTCNTNPTNDCSSYTRADGASCERCFDASGRVIYDSCGADCRDVVCPRIACAAGYAVERSTSECCGQCVPANDCQGVVCPMASPVPDCPTTSTLVRDPTDCCGYVCQPTTCPGPQGLACASDAGCATGEVCVSGACKRSCSTNADCPTTASCINGVCEPASVTPGGGSTPPARVCTASTECLPAEECFDGLCRLVCASSTDCPAPAVCMNGVCLTDGSVQCPVNYAWREDFPYCGQCVPVNDAQYCTADADCQSGESCAFDQGACSAGPSSANGSDPATTAVCYGVCRPTDPTCDASTGGSTRPVAYCEGELVIKPDANGCPYPTCVCPDGTVSLDGTCHNQCDTVQCFAAPPTCDAGYHVDLSYPYCCGVCVPDNVCTYMQNGSGAGTGVVACPAVACAAGFHTELGTDCCPLCVRDLCVQASDCAHGEHCTNQDGACLHPDPTISACYGECVADLMPCVDSDGGIDIFTPGHVTFSAGTGPTTVVDDTCSTDGLSVVEAYCYTTANGPRVETVAVKCPAAACVDSASGAACPQ